MKKHEVAEKPTEETISCFETYQPLADENLSPVEVDVKNQLNPAAVNQAAVEPRSLFEVPQNLSSFPKNIETCNFPVAVFGEYGRLFRCDAIKYMKTLPEASVDLIIADPPYYKVKGSFDFIFNDKEQYLQWSNEWLLEAQRILKDTGTLILWGGVGVNEIMMARLAIYIEDNNLFIRQNWVTQRNTRGYGTQHNYMSAREEFLFLTKSHNYTFNVPYLNEASSRKDLGANGKPRKNAHKRVSNVWFDIAEASQSSIERCAHPTVKALKLCDRIIQTHSNEADSVFIPFAGSGSEIISAILNRRFVDGCELDGAYSSLACERINKLTGIRN